MGGRSQVLEATEYSGLDWCPSHSARSAQSQVQWGLTLRAVNKLPGDASAADGACGWWFSVSAWLGWAAQIPNQNDSGYFQEGGF